MSHGMLLKLISSYSAIHTNIGKNKIAFTGKQLAVLFEHTVLYNIPFWKIFI